jgi:hypothetical protein
VTAVATSSPHATAATATNIATAARRAGFEVDLPAAAATASALLSATSRGPHVGIHVVVAASRRPVSPRRAAVLAVGLLRPWGCFAGSLAGAVADFVLLSPTPRDPVVSVVTAAATSVTATSATSVNSAATSVTVAAATSVTVAAATFVIALRNFFRRTDRPTE